MTHKYLLVSIFLLSFLVRFLYAWKYPPLLWDEAAIGYNAFSILHTGKDEYGQTLPLIFKSFGDYKPGLYIYLTVPFIAIFGLNTLAVRLPSILAGSLLPILIYLLILKLSPKSTRIATIASLILAFNPWNIHFSRGGWETNFMLFELIVAIICFLNNRLLLSSLLFVTTLYTYQAGKIVSPLIILVLFVIYHQSHHSTLRQDISPIFQKFILPLVVCSLPIFYGLLFSSDSSRLQVFSLLSYHRPDIEITQITSESSTLDYQLFHSGPTFFLRNFLTRYFNHFSPRFLTFEGDWQIGRHSAPYNGVLLYPSILFLIIGLFSAAINPSTINIFFLLWLIIGPLPSALTRDIIQPVRSLSLSIPLVYLISVGIYQVLNKFRSIRTKLVLAILFISSFIYYSDLYYLHMVKVKPEDWLYGYQEAVNYIIKNQFNKSVVFTDYYGQPYVFYLFFSQYPPAKYQSQAHLTRTGLDIGHVNQVDDIQFVPPDYAVLRNLPNQLVIMSPADALHQGIDLKTLTPISQINGISTFYALQTQ